MRLLEKEPIVKVGYIGTIKRTGDTKSNAQVAADNEFGATGVPERSFMRSTFDEQVNRWFTITKKYHSAVLAGKMDVYQALEKMGVIIKSDIQAKITSNIPPPNSPATIARKGSDRTLIDTGQLLNSVTQKIVEDGRGERSAPSRLEK